MNAAEEIVEKRMRELGDQPDPREIDRVAAGEWPVDDSPLRRGAAHRGLPGGQVGPPVPARAGGLSDVATADRPAAAGYCRDLHILTTARVGD
jgi:hypothetical protein